MIRSPARLAPAARRALRRISPRIRLAACLLAPLLAAAPARAAAQDLTCDRGDLEVRAVEFEGNRHFRDAELAVAIATTPSSWSRRVGLPFGTRRCLDSLELQRDVYRLRLFYRQHGYYHAEVDTTLRHMEHSAVAITFRIDEGPPVIVDSVTVTGLDTVPDGARLARRLLDRRGKPYDRLELQAIVDTIVERLHDAGYARAELPLRNDSVSLETNRAFVRRDFLPGRIARIGTITFDLEPADSGEAVQIPEPTVRKLLSFEEGDVYRERNLFQSQRDLYLLDAYQHVEIAPVPDSLQPEGDSLVDIVARLHERDMHTVRAGVGWATLDCFRTQLRYVDRDFLGDARRLELNGRLSKIGRGEPLGSSTAICPRTRDDPFSDRINYFAGISLRQPTLFGPRNVPTLTLFSERRSEFKAYQRTTPIGLVASVTRELRPRLPLVLSYQIEYGKTEASDALFCAIFNVCNQSDIARLQKATRLGVLGLSLSRDRTDNPFAPTRGDQLRFELRHASAITGSDTTNRFNKAVGEGAYFHRIGRNIVLAARLQAGVVLAAGSLHGADQLVPAQERLYAGGPNSVRGYNQNELGPVTYIVDSTFREVNGVEEFAGYDVVRASPAGGNTLFVGNLELRIRSIIWPDLLSYVPFLDVGQVYNRGRGVFTFNEVKWTPGLGVRVASPVGPFRLDVAYNGYPRRAGSAFVINGENLVCVSPGAGTLGGTSCPETFAPAPNRTFFSRLVFHFSIGQAF